MSGRRGSPHKQTARVQAIGLEPRHLPKGVTLPFYEPIEIHLTGCPFCQWQAESGQPCNPPPITNIAVMVRDRSRPTLVVRAGLQPPISVYCTQFFFCLHLFWADACLATPAVDGNSFHSGGRLTNDLQLLLLVQRASVGRYCSCLCIPTVQI